MKYRTEQMLLRIGIYAIVGLVIWSYFLWQQGHPGLSMGAMLLAFAIFLEGLLTM